MNANQKNWKWGLWAERIAALFLQLKGYQIRARRYKTPLGEMDLVAQKGKILVAVEVKARQSLKEGLEAVTPRQQERIRRSLEAYVAYHSQNRTNDLRFDVIVVKPWSWPLHIQNAWGY